MNTKKYLSVDFLPAKRSMCLLLISASFIAQKSTVQTDWLAKSARIFQPKKQQGSRSIIISQGWNFDEVSIKAKDNPKWSVKSFKKHENCTGR